MINFYILKIITFQSAQMAGKLEESAQYTKRFNAYQKNTHSAKSNICNNNSLPDFGRLLFFLNAKGRNAPQHN